MHALDLCTTLMSRQISSPWKRVTANKCYRFFRGYKYDQIDRAETHGAQLILFPRNVNEVTEMRQDKCSMPLNMFTETFTSGNMVSTWLKLNIKSYIRT
jgi:hypothetical protein